MEDHLPVAMNSDENGITFHCLTAMERVTEWPMLYFKDMEAQLSVAVARIEYGFTKDDAMRFAFPGVPSFDDFEVDMALAALAGTHESVRETFRERGRRPQGRWTAFMEHVQASGTVDLFVNIPYAKVVGAGQRGGRCVALLRTTVVSDLIA